MSAVSSTFKAHRSVHSEERAISLSWKFCFCCCSCSTNQGSLVISFRSETQFDPCISSVTLSIMIINSNSPVKGSGIPTQFLDVLLHTIACSGLSRVRTECSQPLVIPSLAHHPVQTNRQLSSHGDLGDFPSSPHRQVAILTPPFREAARRDLRRFHQQETQQRVPLFRDMSQPALIPARFLQRHQSRDNSRSACHTETDPLSR